MSYTNVSIPTTIEIDRALYADKQKAELEYWRGLAFDLYRRLENIPDAIEQWGYVVLPNGTRLVPAPQPQGTADE